MCTRLRRVSKEAIKHSDSQFEELIEQVADSQREREREAGGRETSGLSMKPTLVSLVDYLELILVCSRRRRRWRRRSRSSYSAWNNTRGHSNAAPIMKNCRQLSSAREFSSAIHNENI